jgi:hypothetical protein
MAADGQGENTAKREEQQASPRTVSHPPTTVKMFLGDGRGDGLTGAAGGIEAQAIYSSWRSN